MSIHACEDIVRLVARPPKDEGANIAATDHLALVRHTSHSSLIHAAVLAAVPCFMVAMLLLDVYSVFLAASTATPSIFEHTNFSPDCPVMGEADSLLDWPSSNDAAGVVRLVLSPLIKASD
jgi:hypothetical protein